MSARWYKRCGADFIRATMKLTLEEKGAYSLCLDLIYDHGGPIPDDARWLSGVCGVSIRKWSAIRESLIAHGKIMVEGDCLTNRRASLELVSSEFQRRNQAESGAKGGRKRVENEVEANNLNGKGQATLKPIEEKREDKKEDSASALSARTDAEAVVSEWNAMAKATGLPLVSALSDTRRKAIRARLAEHHRAGFTEAIRKIGGSAFCCESKWCGFDWLLKSANFIKVIEGNYDGNANHGNNGRMGRGDKPPVYRRDPAFEGLKRLHAELASGGGFEAIESH